MNQTILQHQLAILIRAIKKSPLQTHLYLDLAETYLSLNQISQATITYHHLLNLEPDNPVANTFLATLALQHHDLDLALHRLHRALSNSTNYFPALINLGTAYKRLGNYSLALEYYRHALAQKPTSPEANYNLGLLQLQLGKPKRALDCFTTATNLGGSFPHQDLNLGLCYEMQNQLDTAIQHYHQAVSSDSTNLLARSHLINLHLTCWNWDQVKHHQTILDRQLFSSTTPSKQPDLPLSVLFRDPNPDHYLHSATVTSNHLASKASFCFLPKPPLTIKIRLGFLSADFSDHVMGYHLLPLIKNLNRSKFTLFLYSLSQDSSLYQHQFRQLADHFIDCFNLSSEAIAHRIHADRLDILIDLSGHTRGGRLQVLSYRPTPIQAHYLGNPATTGANFIDYFLADPLVAPPTSQHSFSEKIAYLPEPYQIIPDSKSTQPYSRDFFNIPTNAFVFGCFNQPKKITPNLLTLWCSLLNHVPNSLLWLIEYHPQATSAIRSFVSSRGIDSARIITSAHLPLDQHLSRLRLVDLALDTSPYSGGSTTATTLMAQVPVITMLGTSYYSRMSSALLSSLGLTELICHNLNAYHSLALALATTSHKLNRIKAKLKVNLSSYPFSNQSRFTHHFEILITLITTPGKGHQTSSPSPFPLAAYPNSS